MLLKSKDHLDTRVTRGILIRCYMFVCLLVFTYWFDVYLSIYIYIQIMFMFYGDIICQIF